MHCHRELECLDENIGVETKSLPDYVNLSQQVLAVNINSVFLHDVRSGN